MNPFITIPQRGSQSIRFFILLFIVLILLSEALITPHPLRVTQELRSSSTSTSDNASPSATPLVVKTRDLAAGIEGELKAHGVSTTIKILSNDPLVYLVPNLLSVDECHAYQDYVQDRPMTRSNPPAVSLDASKLWPLPLLSLLAGVPPLLRLDDASRSSADSILLLQAILPNIAVALLSMGILAGLMVLLIQRLSDASARTSVAVALNLEGDTNFVRDLVERVSVAAGNHPWTKWEAPVVTRYEPGAIFARHGDASPTQGSEWKGLGGQRVVTCICYLNTLSSNQGGETFFDKLDIKVEPQAGSALFFVPAETETWKADDRTTHESFPPTEDKWIVQLFGRAERVPPPLGLPDSFKEQI